MKKLWLILLGLVAAFILFLLFWGIPAPKGEIRKVIPHERFSK